MMEGGMEERKAKNYEQMCVCVDDQSGTGLGGLEEIRCPMSVPVVILQDETYSLTLPMQAVQTQTFRLSFQN